MKTPRPLLCLVLAISCPLAAPSQTTTNAPAQSPPAGPTARYKGLAATNNPADLKGALIWMDSFMGVKNANIMADVVSMTPDNLIFNMSGRLVVYSGHYTVMLNTPRAHASLHGDPNPPMKANLVTLKKTTGDPVVLTNAMIWEKSDGFIDVVSGGNEWIHSGDYTIQAN